MTATVVYDSRHRVSYLDIDGTCFSLHSGLAMFESLLRIRRAQEQELGLRRDGDLPRTVAT